ncbi:MAG TPA: 16S rRNA processing protein RimM [Candidatus Ornithomonoglobus intestinigallinarum]|uniref:Ribosome maturation factor RimM n=1 Tax=Candidatus Ornithomonoglobus intestinigallinarum TaxID=2840894 RepID=A0A9D1H3H2_9FIRM|nr:16S rRNA processing protein RimM [Candidatus Ornithomonoglobus intestinigallinarum]
MEFLEVGKIINTHGLRGDVKVMPWTDTPEDFEDIPVVYIKRKDETEKLTVSKIKYQKNNLIVKFKEINDINEAEKYKGITLLADRDDLWELEEGVYYIADLIGLDVYDENGRIGVIADVLNTGANDIYDVKREGKKNLLLPVIDEVVKEVDLENGRVTVHVMEGLDE